MPMVAEPHPTHPFLAVAIDNRRLAGLDSDGGTVIDGQFDSFLVAQPHQRVAGDTAFALGPAGPDDRPRRATASASRIPR